LEIIKKNKREGLNTIAKLLQNLEDSVTVYSYFRVS